MFALSINTSRVSFNLKADLDVYTTAYSYFFEMFENLNTQDDPGALNMFEYMLLCKVMLNLVSCCYFSDMERKGDLMCPSTAGGCYQFAVD